MTDANYLKHVKVLGKLCRLYDDAAADLAAQKQLVDALFDQMSTGDGDGFDALITLGPQISTLNGAINNGAASIKSQAKTMTEAYLLSSMFKNSFDTPLTVATAKAVLEALIAEMTADSKTFTTAASTGLVNFFETEWAPSGDFPQSGTPTYADATYVVTAVV